MPKAERRYVVPLLASRRGEKDDTRYRKTFAPAHYSHFVFRNNTVCSGKRRGFPVIYRQSDEARQTEPPIISFPLISPLSWAIVQPAAGSLSRLQIGWQKRNGNQPFRFSDCQKSLKHFCRRHVRRQKYFSARKRASVSECAAASRSLFQREPSEAGLV